MGREGKKEVLTGGRTNIRFNITATQIEKVKGA